MRIIIKSIVLFSLLIAICLFLKSCTPEEEYSLVKNISKTWKISTLTVDGNLVVGTEAFALTLDQKADQPTTFIITTGGVAYNFAPTTTGSWSLNNNDNPTQATFAGNTVNFTASSEQLVIQYSLADRLVGSIVRFTFVPR